MKTIVAICAILIFHVSTSLYSQCNTAECNNAMPLLCGVPVDSINNAGVNCIETYQCGNQTISDLVGIENYYIFTLTATTDIEISLTNISIDADVYLASVCESSGGTFQVIACDPMFGTLNEFISVPDLGPGQYYVIVDGVLLPSAYTLELSCCPSAETNCDVNYSTPLPYGTNHEFADIDNDGFLDLLQYQSFGDLSGIIAYLYDPMLGYTFQQSAILAEDAFDFTLSSHYQIGDLNNDNLVDLVISGTGSNGNFIHGVINLGGGVFQQVNLANWTFTFSFNHEMVLGDADNDGDQDVIACDGSTCYLYRNNGDFPFEQDILDLCLGFNTFLTPKYLVDFDKDGHNDLLALTQIEDEVIVTEIVLFPNINSLCGNCEGMLTLPGESIQDIGDHDNDGDLDILTADHCPFTNFLVILENQYPGFAFTQAPLETINACGLSVQQAQWKDIDGDEDLDLGLAVGYCEEDESVRIFRNDDLEYLRIFEEHFFETIVFGDFDMDGQMGFCGIIDSGGTFFTYLAEIENCGFNTPPLAPASPETTIIPSHGDVLLQWSSAIDPDYDMAIPHPGLSYNIILENDSGEIIFSPLANTESGKRALTTPGAQSLDTFWYVKELPTGNYTWKVQAIDNSCAGGAWSTTSAFALENCFDLLPQEIDLELSSFQFHDINLADFSTIPDNPLLDLIFKRDFQEPFPEIVENLDELSFEPYYAFDDPGDYVISDLNNDNLLDILLYFSGNFFIYLNDAGGFLSPQVFEGGFTDPIIGDIDNDGDRDILLGEFSSGDILLIENLGNGAFDFSLQVIYADAQGTGRNLLGLFDADLDGDLDALASNNFLSDPGIRRLEILYSGNGVFHTATDIGADYGVSAIGDIDNDGDKDIINGFTDCEECLVDENTQLFKNDTGNFMRIAIDVLPCNYAYEDLQLGDMDHDGDLDLISIQRANQFDEHLYIHRNDLETAGHVEFSEVYEQRYIDYFAIGDIDGDLDLDVVYPPIISECGCLEVLTNNTCVPNTPPSAPMITGCVANGDSITITWDAATDAEQPDTTLTYNLAITKFGDPDSLIISPMADLDSGIRKLVHFGEQCENLSWTIKDLDMTAEYCIRVQAVDNSYAGGAWSEEVCCSFCPPSASTVFVEDGITDLLLCRGQDIEIVEFEYLLADSLASVLYTFFITDSVGNIIVQSDSVFDFSQWDPGKYLVYGISYFGELLFEPGSHVSTIESTVCDTLSDNFISIRINQPVIIFEEDLQICPGESIPLVVGTNGVDCSWSPAEGLTSSGICSPEASPEITTTYAVIVATIYGCKIEESVTVLVDPLPVVFLQDEITICAGESIALPVTTEGEVSCMWTPSAGLDDPGSCNPVASPAVTTSYTVTVTDENGCTNSATTVVTVINNPIAVAGGNTSICLGECTTLTGSGGSSCAWYLDGDFFSGPIGTSCQIQVCPEETSTYTLVVFTGNFCSDTTSITVFVNDLPEVTVPDVTICTGEAVVLPATTSGGVTCLWTPSAGLDDPITCNPEASPTVTTAYTVVVTDVNGCTNSTETVVTVIENPVADPGDDAEICLGECITLFGSGGSFCAWYLEDDFFGGPISTFCQFEVCPDQTTTYTLVVTGENNCRDTASVTIEVNDLPEVSVADETICAGDSTILEVNAPESVFCAWTPSGGLDDPSSCNPEASPGVTTVYTVVVTDENGCTNATETVVTVVDNPVADAGDNVAICFGECITLNGTGGSSCAWYLDGDFGSGPIGTFCQLEVCPEVTTTYSLVVFGGNNCSDTTSVTVLVNDLPEIAVSDVTICAGQRVELPVVTFGDVICQWSPATGLDDPGLCMPTASPDFTTTYTVLVTGENGCESTASLTVTVIPKPVANPGPDAEICIGDCITLNGSGGTSCVWYAEDDFNAGPLTTNCQLTVCPEESTYYTLVVFGEQNCSDTARVNVTVHPLPEIAVFNATICAGDTIPMPVDPIGTLNCQWSPATGLINPNLCDPLVSPAVTTTYTVTITDENGCVNTNALTINVIENPVANAGPDITICAGDPPVQLSGSGGTTCAWYDAQGVLLNNACNLSVSPQASTFYVLEVTIQTGKLVCSDRDTIAIQVIPLPTLELSNDTALCSGVTIPLVITNTGITCSWIPVTGLNDPSSCFPQLTTAISTTYTVVVSDAFGCATTDSMRVDVVAQPEAVIQALDGICLGDTTTLVGSGGSVCTWYLNDLMTPISQECVIQISPADTTRYIFETANSSEDVVCFDIDSIDLEVYPLPMVELQQDMTICANGFAQLVLSLNCQGCMCFWSPETELNDPESCIPILNPQSPGDKTIAFTAIDINGCQTTDTAFVSVIPVPTADIMNDHVTIRRGETEAFEILENDDAVGEWVVTLLSEPEGVSVSLDENNQLVVSAGGSFLGLTSVDYELSDPLCGKPSQSGTVEIQVIETDKVCICDPALEETGCSLLPNIGDFPNNRIVIFNRYGNIVHLDSPYENNWNGVNIETGKDVPTGAYYFILDLGTDNNGVDGGTIKGVILIVRMGK